MLPRVVVTDVARPPRVRLPRLGDEPAGEARHALLAKGFRPFFLAAMVAATVLVPAWLVVRDGAVAFRSSLSPGYWHAHEMVFGYSTAVIAGFLLTATSNWTGRSTAVGVPLAALVATWTLGRAAMLFVSGPSPVSAALADLAFLPALTVVVGRPLVASRSRRNYPFLVLLVALWAANVLVHLDGIGLLTGGQRLGAMVGVDVVVLFVLIVAGRVMPMFTGNATGVEVVSRPALDGATVVGMSSTLVAGALSAEAPTQAVLSGSTAVLVVARAWGWGTRAAVGEPMLWVLHVGHAWVAAGMALRAASWTTPTVPAAAATHALTVGAIGTLTLGMMVRVTLGHTGRPIRASRVTQLAFLLITGAALVRVGGAFAPVDSYRPTLLASGIAWSAAFLLALVEHAAKLWSPRLDGRLG